MASINGDLQDRESFFSKKLPTHILFLKNELYKNNNFTVTQRVGKPVYNFFNQLGSYVHAWGLLQI